MKENTERELRKQNIVILGTKPSGSNDSKQKEEDDKTELKKMFQAIGVDFGVVKKFWLFKSKPESKFHPPILVKLHENVERMDIVAAGKKLSKLGEFNRVYINPDLTLFQREEERELRKMRNELNSKASSEKQPFRWAIRSRLGGERLFHFNVDDGNQQSK